LDEESSLKTLLLHGSLTIFNYKNMGNTPFKRELCRTKKALFSENRKKNSIVGNIKYELKFDWQIIFLNKLKFNSA